MKKIILWILISCFLLNGCNKGSISAKPYKTLTLAVFSEYQLSGNALSKWVNLYNANHTDVKIEMVNYAANFADPYEAYEQLKIEIIAGKGPDLISFGSSFYSPLDASNGMLADLYPLMQYDALFDKQDFYENIIDSFAVGESLFVLVPGFGIASYATVHRALRGLESADIYQIVDAYNTLDEDSVLIPGETKGQVLGWLLYGSLANYIDWDAGMCRFDSPSFKELLLFADQFPLFLNFANDWSVKDYFTEGRALMFPTSIEGVYSMARTRMLFGETPTYIGYPFDEGNGNLATMTDVVIGISAASKSKAEAWDFLRSLLSDEFQDNLVNGLPLRVHSLEQKLEKALQPEYDANGRMIVKERLIFEGEASVDIYEILIEDAETLKSLLRKIEFCDAKDPDIYSIIFEEADYLFNENRDVDAVADIIQNRVSLYIKESK